MTVCTLRGESLNDIRNDLRLIIDKCRIRFVDFEDELRFLDRRGYWLRFRLDILICNLRFIHKSFHEVLLNYYASTHGRCSSFTASSVPFNSVSFGNRSLISSMVIMPTNPKSELVNASRRLAASVLIIPPIFIELPLDWLNLYW